MSLPASKEGGVLALVAFSMVFRQMRFISMMMIIQSGCGETWDQMWHHVLVVHYYCTGVSSISCEASCLTCMIH